MTDESKYWLNGQPILTLDVTDNGGDIYWINGQPVAGLFDSGVVATRTSDFFLLLEDY